MRNSMLAIVGSVFLGLAMSPLRADVSVSGGAYHQRAFIQSIYQTMIPARFHTRQTVAVHLLDDRQMATYLNSGDDSLSASHGENDTIDGVFEDGPPLITLRETRPDDEIQFTVAHEYGHYLWEHLMNRSEKVRYARIYRVQRSNGSLVSDYAGTSLNEGFAEAFSYYVNDGDELAGKDPLSMQFIDSLFVDHVNSMYRK